MQVMWVLRDESFKQSGDDIVFADAVDDLRVEVLHFLPVSFMQDLLAIALFDVAFGAMTGGENEREADKRAEP